MHFNFMHQSSEEETSYLQCRRDLHFPVDPMEDNKVEFNKIKLPRDCKAIQKIIRIKLNQINLIKFDIAVCFYLSHKMSPLIKLSPRSE